MKYYLKQGVWISKLQLKEELNLKFLKTISSKLKNSEIAKAEVFIDLHKCPWYKRIFNKLPKYILIQGNNGIGTWSKMKCEHCGKTYDITDYGYW